MPVTLASDPFVYSNQSGWPSPWNTSFRGTGTYSISSNEGLNSSNSGTFSIAKYGSGTATDQEVSVRQNPADTTSNIGTVARIGSSSNFYYGLLVGGVARIGKCVSGTFTTLASTSVTYSTSNFYWLRFNLEGPNLRLRFWQDGSSEPSSWTVTTTDTSLTSGGYGLGSDATGTTKFDNFTVTDASNYKPVGMRFLQAIAHTQSVGTRLRQAVNATKSVGTRLRLAVNHTQFVSTRFLLASNKTRSVGTRFLLAIARTKSVGARLLQATEHTQSVWARLRLGAFTLKSIGTRLRLATNATKSMRMRLLVAILRTQSVGARLLLAIARNKSIGSRLLLAVNHIQSVRARLRVAISATRSSQIRLRQATGRMQSTQTRLRQAVPHTQSSSVRVRIASSRTRYNALRLLLATGRVLSVGTRLRQASGHTQSSQMRFCLASLGGHSRTKSFGCRFVLQPLTVPFSATLPSTNFTLTIP